MPSLVGSEMCIRDRQIFPRAVRTTELPSNPSPLTFRNNQIQILQTSSTHATMAANVFQQDANTHGTRLSHARTRQSFSDTTHKKWSEWKTNRSVVITGRFRRERQGWGSLKPSDLIMEKNEKKKYFLQNRPAITALRLVSIPVSYTHLTLPTIYSV